MTTSRFILKELSRYRIGTFADIIYRNALLYGDREAFVYQGEKINFAEYNARVNSLIHALHKMGVKKGDVIGILAWNCLEFTYVYGAAMKGGFIVSPYNYRLQSDELDYLVNYSEANTLFVGPELVGLVNSLKPRLPRVKNFLSLEGPAPDMVCLQDLLPAYSREEPDEQIAEDDPAYIVYTSGTTGVPRGALHTHRQAIDNSQTMVIIMSLQTEDKHLQIMPLFHIGGLCHLMAFLYVGASNVIMPQRTFDPAVTLQALQDEKVTSMDMTVTHLVSMLGVPDVKKYDLSRMKRMWYGASNIYPETLKKAIDTWGQIFIQGYGQTETGPQISDLSIPDHTAVYGPPEQQKILASAGHPSIGVHVRIVDDKENDVGPGEVGEIIVQSKHIMVEFWRKAQDTVATMPNGWVHTGDMGYYDERGYIYIADRKRDMIKSGGENVFPREVEDTIYQHPSVLEAAVIGIPDPYWIEKVHAVVVLKEGASLSEQELISFCKEKLARFKAPKSVEFMESLPKNPTGKILKKELRKKYQTGPK